MVQSSMVQNNIRVYSWTEIKKGFRLKPFCFGDPPEARTQDPHIKSVMLYQLS